jgi:hypothetical protein
MRLPKLYRVVYVEIEYCNDYLQGGEHVQDEGEYYTKAQLVIGSNGMRKWKFLDKDFLDGRDYKYIDDGLFPDEGVIDFMWFSVDKYLVEFEDKYRHDPENSYKHMTIKELRQPYVEDNFPF